MFYCCFLDVLDVKLKKAAELGADSTIKIEKNMSEDEICKLVIEKLGVEPNKVFDCTGAEPCVRVALKVSKTSALRWLNTSNFFGAMVTVLFLVVVVC